MKELNCPVEVAKLSGKGEIYSFTTVRRFAAPGRFIDFAPYTVALVRLDEGMLVTAMLTDIDIELENGLLVPKYTQDGVARYIEIGTRVEEVTRKLYEDGAQGMIVYGTKFRPILLRE